MTPESRMESQPRLLLVHGSVANADLTWSAQKPLGRAVRDRGAEPARLPARTGRRPRRLRGGGGLARAIPRTGHASRRALVRWRHRAARRGANPGASPFAHGDRAAGVRGRARDPGCRRVRRANRGALDERPARPRRVPARLPLPRRFVDPARELHAGAPPGRAHPDGGTAAVRGGDPVRRARTRAVPEARRVRRAQRGVRGGLRRARGAARRRAGRPTGRRTLGAAARRAVQRAAGELRRRAEADAA